MALVTAFARAMEISPAELVKHALEAELEEVLADEPTIPTKGVHGTAAEFFAQVA